MKDRYEEVPHRADVLERDDEPIGRRLGHVQAVRRGAGQIVDLCEVVRRAGLHLLGREVRAA